MTLTPWDSPDPSNHTVLGTYCTSGSVPQFTKNPIYVFPEMKLRGLVPNSYIVSVTDLYILGIGLHIWLWQNSRLILGILYINRSQINESRKWETKYYNSILKYRGHAVSFLGIHKSETDIYIGFPPALHLQ